MEKKFRVFYTEHCDEDGLKIKGEMSTHFTLQKLADHGCGQDFTSHIIMQFTGKTDKRGDDIFQHDIFRINKTLVFVDWNESDAQWDLFILKSRKSKLELYEDECGLTNIQNYRIVGNLWESDIKKLVNEYKK